MIFVVFLSKLKIASAPTNVNTPTHIAYFKVYSVKVNAKDVPISNEMIKDAKTVIQSFFNKWHLIFWTNRVLIAPDIKDNLSNYDYCPIENHNLEDDV